MSLKNSKNQNSKKKTAKILSIIIAAVALIAIVIAFTFANNGEVATEDYDINSPARVGAVTLTVGDIKTMSEFYQKTIGFNVLKDEGERVTLTADGKNPILILEEKKDALDKPFGTTGLYHFALLLPDERTLGQFLIHLSDSLYLQGAADHQYSKALYLADPEGNGIEIYADIPSNEWIRDGKGGYVGGTYQLNVAELYNLAKDDEWTGLPEGTKMGHMHLQVADIEESETFYTEVLGFDIVAKNDSHLFVSFDGYHHHIGMNTWLGKGIPSPPDNAKGLKHFTVLLTQPEWTKVKENLTEENISFNENGNEIEVNDPAGITLHLINKYE